MLNLKKLLKSKTFCKIAFIGLGAIIVSGLAWTLLDKSSPISISYLLSDDQKNSDYIHLNQPENYCQKDEECALTTIYDGCCWTCGG